MSDKLKRYDIRVDGDALLLIEPDKSGEPWGHWCMSESVEKLEAELKTIKIANTDLATVNGMLESENSTLQEENKSLREARDE